MANVFDYVKKNADLTFAKKPFTEVDNLVFSLLTYLDFDGTLAVGRGGTMRAVAERYFELNSLKEVAKFGMAQSDAYKLLKFIHDKPRYRDVIVSNFEYDASGEYQFGAACFWLNKRLMFLSFEGTDYLMDSWREDFEFCYNTPTVAERKAIEYFNRVVRVAGPDVIMGGHSKGGHLALIAAMYGRRLKTRKIVRIFSNDGPGLRRDALQSYRYAGVRGRYTHFVPSNSIVGMLLYDDCYVPIRSRGKGFNAHQLSTWEVVGDKIRPAKALSENSVKLRNGVRRWLEEHDDYDREKMTNMVFGIFKMNGIEATMDIKSAKNIIKVIRSVKNLDDSSKELALGLIKYAFALDKLS